ncbi:ATP-binding protein [Streptomyces netropsis]|uniref:ATP-binding protein n=1 Tax=Streptomyces netropsis TaxID=55404 RepID=A0A7W7LAB7_STRNE|nr:ATP-binding protein [Streptomyces netropsis]MBB4885991.1 hypothetical protein [Streptomyces netropsis]GGR17379.1 ATP-binding protein [Streptomyces netropsis]
MSLPLTRRIAQAALLVAAGAAGAVGAAGVASAADVTQAPLSSLDTANLTNNVSAVTDQAGGTATNLSGKAVEGVPAATKTVGKVGKEATPVVQKAAGQVGSSAGKVVGETANTATKGGLPSTPLGG